MSQVIAVVHEEKGAYGISFPDFPGCVSGGATIDEALRRGRETLRVHLDAMLEDGEAVPAVRSLDQLKNDQIFRDDAASGLAVALPFDLPSQAVRIDIALDECLIPALDEAAERAGLSRADFISDAMRAKLKA